MPITAQSADGRTHEFPDGTDRAVIDRVMKNYAAGAKQVSPAMQHPQDMGVGERLTTGFMDPMVGAEQLHRHMGGGDAESYDKFVQERERNIRQRTEGGFDWARTAGSMANPLNLFPSGMAAKAARPAAKIATGAVGGMVGAAQQPITEGDFATGKAAQSGLGAGAGAGLGLGSSIAGRAIRKSGSTVEELEKSARAGYDALTRSNTMVKEDAVTQAHKLIMDDLRSNHFRDYLHPQTFAVLKEIGSHTGPADMGDIKGWQELLKKVSGDPGDREAARHALGLFDNILLNVQPKHVISGDPQRDAAILRKAQADWRGARRSDVVDMSIERSERQAGSSGSGSNKENTVRQRINAILNSPTQAKMFSADEIATMKEIVKGTIPINAMRSIGKFAPTGVVSSMPTLGALFSEKPLAATLAAPAVAAKYGAEAMTKNKAKDLAESIRAKAPSYVPGGTPPLSKRAPVAGINALAPGAGSALGQPDDPLSPSAPARLGPRSDLGGQVMSDASPDPIKPGQRFASMLKNQPPIGPEGAGGGGAEGLGGGIGKLGRSPPNAAADAAAKTARYRRIMRARAGNTSGQIEDQQQKMKDWAESIGYQGGFSLPPRTP